MYGVLSIATLHGKVGKHQPPGVFLGKWTFFRGHQVALFTEAGRLGPPRGPGLGEVSLLCPPKYKREGGGHIMRRIRKFYPGGCPLPQMWSERTPCLTLSEEPGRRGCGGASGDPHLPAGPQLPISLLPCQARPSPGSAGSPCPHSQTPRNAADNGLALRIGLLGGPNNPRK